METCNCENPKDMIHKAMVKIFDDLESEYTNKAQVSKPPLINASYVWRCILQVLQVLNPTGRRPSLLYC